VLRHNTLRDVLPPKEQSVTKQALLRAEKYFTAVHLGSGATPWIALQGPVRRQ